MNLHESEGVMPAPDEGMEAPAKSKLLLLLSPCNYTLQHLQQNLTASPLISAF